MKYGDIYWICAQHETPRALYHGSETALGATGAVSCTKDMAHAAADEAHFGREDSSTNASGKYRGRIILHYLRESMQCIAREERYSVGCISSNDWGPSRARSTAMVPMYSMILDRTQVLQILHCAFFAWELDLMS
jgi:hypothetical protein